MYLMGIDVGTTGVKGVLISQRGETVAESINYYPVHSPRTNWFEQNPDDWWKAAVLSIQKMLKSSGIKPSQVAGIGLSGQYHGLVIVNRNLKVLRPCIMWNDQRTAKQGTYIVEKIGTKTLMEIAATRGAPYFTACKLLWVRENEPGVYEKIYKMMLPKDYIRLKLTGEFVTDVTDASGTLFLDVHKRRWSPELLEKLEVDREILPAVVESPDVTGLVTKKAAEETGLKPGIPVAGGGGDQAAAAIGNGIVEEGLISYSIGTSGVVYAATERVLVDEYGRIDSFCHAVPGTWCLLACINSAAGSLRWFEERFLDFEKLKAKERGVSIYKIIEEKALEVPPGSDRLIFLPYLVGERHPHTDPNAKGVFFGLHSGHTKQHALRAVLEGVAYSFRDCLEVTKELGIVPKEIRATGGGAKSKLWINIQVNTSGHPIVETTTDEGGAAYGAAILGGVCCGIFKTVKEACSSLVKTKGAVEPDPELMKLYDRYYRFYRNLYPLFKNSYQELAKL